MKKITHYLLVLMSVVTVALSSTIAYAAQPSAEETYAITEERITTALESIKDTKTKRVGDKTNGYLDVPETYVDFHDVGVQDFAGKQWSYIDGYHIVTLMAFDPQIVAQASVDAKKLNISLPELFGSQLVQGNEEMGLTVEFAGLLEGFENVQGVYAYFKGPKDQIAAVFHPKDQPDKFYMISVEGKEEEVVDLFAMVVNSWKADK
ncbi:MAG: hypothetical protein Q4B80_04660 [Aerococcaceae bacterium]|nr:hypothetical protein [Aerococcaceae bacterium]